MSRPRSQLATLLRTALLVDFRSRWQLPSRRGRRNRSFLWALLFYTIIGATWGGGLAGAALPLHLYVTLTYALASVFVFLNIMLEYQEILLAPTDADVLFWRPITSRTLFLAKVLHIVFYVGILAAALLLVPSLLTLTFSPARGPLVILAFGIGGLLNALFATSVTVLLYGLLLRRISPERLQDLLAYIQIGFTLLLFLGQMSVGNLAMRFKLGQNPAVLGLYHWLPPAWFGALPAAVAEGLDARLALLLGEGLVLFALCGSIALVRLAPRYETDIEQVGAAEGSSTPAARRAPRDVQAPRFERAFGNLVARNTMTRAGFDFFMANLRGDRKLKVTLWPNLAIPVALLFYAFLMGQTADPYAVTPRSSESAQLAPARPGAMEHLAVASRTAQSPAPREGQTPGEDASPRRRGNPPRGPFHLFMAVYFLALYGILVSRMISASNSWKASWVFHAAPVRHFDRFYSGVLWGVFYGLTLPAACLIVAALLVVWHNPLHVAAHLALPCAIALCCFPIVLLLDPVPPFSREPQRGQRSRDMAITFVAMGPLVLVAVAQYLLRGHALALVGAGLLLGSVGLLLWWLVNRRVSTILLTRSFEG